MGSSEECFNNTFFSSYDDLSTSDPALTPSNCINESSFHNVTGKAPYEEYFVNIVVGIILGLLILVTVVGNVFVLAAIWMEKNLHSLQNYLIFSLAVADLMVGCLVMPIGAVYEISGDWLMGEYLCTMWTSSDVLSCTASILHLVAIAIDRYHSVTNIDYMHRRNSQRVLTMIMSVWVAALIIMGAQLVWEDETWHTRIAAKECTVNQDKYFQIFATLSSFYVPLAVILILYWKIFQAARKRIRKRRPPPATSLLPRPAAETSLITTASSSNPSPEKTVLINNYGGVKDSAGGGEEVVGAASVAVVENPRKGTIHHKLLPPGSPGNSSTGITPETTPARIIKTTKESGESKRERKAAKTLAIITGAFIGCWLLFFVVALTLSICGQHCSISRHTMALIQWLGFFNSTLNPVIYTIFSPEFRLAFKKILCGKAKYNQAVAV